VLLNVHLNVLLIWLRMCFECAFNVLWMRFQCALNALSMCFECAFNVLWMRFECAFNVLWMRFQCALNALSMCFECAFNVLWMRFQCALNALSMCFVCAFKVAFECNFPKMNFRKLSNMFYFTKLICWFQNCKCKRNALSKLLFDMLSIML